MCFCFIGVVVLVRLIDCVLISAETLDRALLRTLDGPPSRLWGLFLVPFDNCKAEGGGVMTSDKKNYERAETFKRLFYRRAEPRECLLVFERGSPKDAKDTE